MKNAFLSSFKGLIKTILPLCSLIISCNSSSPTSPEQKPSITTLTELKITDSEISGWTTSAENADTFCVNPKDSFYSASPGSLDGGLDRYDSAGCKTIAYQALTGPSSMTFQSHTYDFLTPSKATSMFTLLKSLKSPVLSVTGFETSVAFATKGSQSLTVYAHFNQYHFEFSVVGFTDDAVGMDIAAHFLTVYKNKIK